MIVPIFVLKVPASDWYLFLLVAALFMFGIWLLVSEVRNWLNRQTGLYQSPPSSIVKLLNSIFRSSPRSPIERTPPETENQSAAVADVTPEKAA